MSDFFSSGWSIFIAVATLGGLLACLALLAIASRRVKMADDNSTGHVFDDDLVEMNNPLPLWWMILFILTVLFAFGYVYAFPALGGSPGTLGWTSAGELAADQAAAKARAGIVFAAFAGKPAEALAKDPKAMEIGQRLFLNNCSNCHGSDARGSKGFPNLTDNDWLHGGTPEKIEESITNGRIGVMPPMAAAVGTAADVHDVANYVMSLSGDPHDAMAAAAGKKKFVVCAACHGADGKGNQVVGAPNLTDKIWLHGWGEAAITAMVNNGKTNVMPAQGGRLPPEQIHLLAAYVWSLSQPQLTASK
jgi:cytochrome c oxidase cbb3-type subunit 3